MKKNKYIKEIAARLPIVLEKTISGYYEDYNQEGELVKFPNFVSHPINHERRIRHAYKHQGMPGVLQYLTWINQLQNESLQRSSVNGLEEQDLQGEVPGAGDQPADTGVDTACSV